jgi:hypothetical protein
MTTSSNAPMPMSPLLFMESLLKDLNGILYNRTLAIASPPSNDLGL